MSLRSTTSFRSSAVAALLFCGTFGAFVSLRILRAPEEPVTSTLHAWAGADEFRDDDCPPFQPINAVGSSGGGGLAGQLQSELCPTIQVTRLPIIPEDPCPDPEPCFLPAPKDEMPGGGMQPAGGFGMPGASLTLLRDQPPVDPDWNDYDRDPLRRAGMLDSPYVDATTGELTWTEQDLLLPGAGIDFAVTRFYHSGLAEYESQYGLGWEISVHRKLIVKTYDPNSLDPNVLQIVTGGGYPTGEFSDPDQDGWFYHDSRRAVLEYSEPSGVPTFKHYAPNGMIETYEQLTTGENWFYLTKSENLFGSAVEFTYRDNNSASPTTWCLDYVTDSVGRVIEFEYDDTLGLLDSILVKDGTQTISQIDYTYSQNAPYLLTQVTGLEVATKDPQSSAVLMQRRVHEYGYTTSSGTSHELLTSFKNGNGQTQHAWTFDSNTDQVLTQTDRADGTPLRTASNHSYSYSPGLTEYEGPSGERREWELDTAGRVEKLREALNSAETLWAETSYYYSSACTECAMISRIEFDPEDEDLKRTIEIQYDAEGNPKTIWTNPVNGSGAPVRVERFLWSSFDPENGSMLTRLLQHELIRDAQQGEGPTSNCNHPECGNQYSADGWIMYEYEWDQSGNHLVAIDYGTIAKANWSGAGTMNRREEFTYHADGRVATRTEIEDSVDVVVTEFDLDASGHFVATVTINDPLNSETWETNYVRDFFGWIIQTEHPNGTYTRTERDEAGRVYQIKEDYNPGTSAASRTTEIRYDEEGRLVLNTVSDGSLSQQVELVLDETGAPLQVKTTGPGGPTRTATVDISPSGLLLSVTDWRGVQSGTDYGIGALQLPTRKWEKLGTSERTIWQAGVSSSDSGYDSRGRLTGWRNAAGWPTAIVYDGLGRLQEVFTQTDSTHVSGRHFNYDSRGYVQEVEVGMTTGTADSPSMGNFSWNEHHVYGHNLAGHLLSWALYEGSETTPARMQRFQVDLRGRKDVILNFQGNRADGVNNAVKVARDFIWDGMDRKVEERSFESWSTSSSAVAETTSYSYDDANRTVQVVITGDATAYAEKALAQLDELGRVTSITEWEWTGSAWGTSRVFEREWDALDRQTAAVDPLDKRWEWDYDDLHRVVEETVVPYDSSGNQVTSWLYDSSTGLLDSVTDAEGEVTEYTYHPSGAAFFTPKRITYADGRWEELSNYDALLRATEVEDSRGVIRTLVYDYYYLTEDDSNLEALMATDSHFAGADEMQWEYDPFTGYPTASKLLADEIEVWRTEFDYNKIGELESEIQGPLNDSNNARHTWEWTWGFGGEMREVSYPSDFGLDAGVATWDAGGRLSGIEYTKSTTTIADYLLTYSGQRLEQRTEQESDIVLDYSYDSWNRLTGMIWSKGSTVYDGQERTLDIGNRVIARKRPMDSTGEVFTHDGHHRMTKWWQGVSSALSWTGASDPSTWTEVERYTLDKVFARSQVQREINGGSTTTTNYTTNDAHFYTAVGSESRTTHHGYLNGDGTFYYRWDAWGRLTEVRQASNGHLRRRHLYDCEGRRVRTEEFDSSGDPERTTRYVYMGMGLASSYENGSGDDLRTYGYVGGADGEAFVVVEESTSADGVYELARDFQGSMLALMERTSPSSVTVVERYRYEPFGAVEIEDGSGQPLSGSAFINDRFFMGRVWDAEIGIYDVRARWYEPIGGVFISPDPLGAVDSWNLFQYGLAEPQSVFDASGMQVGGHRAAAGRMQNALRDGSIVDDIGKAVADGIADAARDAFDNADKVELGVATASLAIPIPVVDEACALAFIAVRRALLWTIGLVTVSTIPSNVGPREGEGEAEAGKTEAGNKAGEAGAGEESGVNGGSQAPGAKTPTPPKAGEVKGKDDLPEGWQDWPSGPTKNKRGTRWQDPDGSGRGVKWEPQVKNPHADPAKKHPDGYWRYADGKGGKTGPMPGKPW